MRSLIAASALLLIGVGVATAQPFGAGAHGALGNQHQATQGQPVPTGRVDFCTNSETLEGGLYHHFSQGGAPRYIHVTDHGLILSASNDSSTVGETSSEAEARFKPQIDALRAAGVANARVTLTHDAHYVVTSIVISYQQRCS